MNEEIEIIKNINSLIGLKGLGFEEHDKIKENHAMFYTKEVGQIIQQVQYSFGIAQRKGDMILNNINSGIAFPLVNKILEKTILSLKPGNRIYFFLSNFQDKDNIISGEAITIKNYKIQNDGNFLSDVLSVKILNNGSYIDDNLVVLTKMISNHIDSYILPFFNQIKDLQQMNDEIINKIPQNEIGKYLNGMLMCYKKQIIMKLCNNPNYEKYTNWLLELNKDDYENGKERFDGEYEFHMTLIDYLGNMNY